MHHSLHAAELQVEEPRGGTSSLAPTFALFTVLSHKTAKQQRRNSVRCMWCKVYLHHLRRSQKNRSIHDNNILQHASRCAIEMRQSLCGPTEVQSQVRRYIAIMLYTFYSQHNGELQGFSYRNTSFCAGILDDKHASTQVSQQACVNQRQSTVYDHYHNGM